MTGPTDAPSVGRMPSLRDLEIVHRLNAPTRSAATRRRRLRKACACLCVVGAALVATGGGSGRGQATPASSSSSPAPSARNELQGRHLVPIRADDSLVERVTTSSRVDVWAPDGTRLAAGAPVIPPDNSSHQMDTVPSGRNAQLLVALTPTDVARIARHDDHGQAPWSELVVTMRP